MGLQGATAPRFGPMADGSMEREGEAAEGRVAYTTINWDAADEQSTLWGILVCSGADNHSAMKVSS